MPEFLERVRSRLTGTDARFLLRAISVAAMLSAALPVVLAPDAEFWSGWLNRTVGVLLIAATCVSFWFLTRHSGKHAHPALASLLVGVQLITGLLVAVDLLYVLVFELPLVMSRHRAGLWFTLLCAIFLALWIAYLPVDAPNYHRMLTDPVTRQQVIDVFSTLLLLTFAFLGGCCWLQKAICGWRCEPLRIKRPRTPACRSGKRYRGNCTTASGTT